MNKKKKKNGKKGNVGGKGIGVCAAEKLRKVPTEKNDTLPGESGDREQ